MHGDFSRGHRPDAKRGKSYTRGFAQQRRLLLDSDLNAMTDALHERLRALARHTGCPKGSPDLGYLVTPGRLLALFDDLDGVVTASSNVTYFRDYSRKYLDRYPSLAVEADQGAAGSVTLRLRALANGQTVFWCRAEAATQVMLTGGVPLNVPAGAILQAVTVNLANVQNLQIDFNVNEAIWIGLIEVRQNATLAPLFNFAEGYYYLDGLPLFNPSNALWASTSVPPLVPNNFPNLAASDRLLVYLEGTERHVTSVEDPGIIEHALGGDSDTTTRGRAVGQVKVVEVPPTFNLERFSQALNNPVPSNGTLNVTTPPAAPDPDPCALPVQGGYTGSDNRFYRFEVHTGGALGTAVIKWSRDNGAELFPIVNATNQTLTFPATTLLQPGDLVEILTADSIESGDASLAVLTAATNSFTPAVRSVGRLVRLQAGTGSGAGVAFTLREPNGIGVVTLAPHFGGFPTTTLKVRRWHGLIATIAAPVPNVVEIENGIEVELNGSFSPGDYWQYEARAGSDNANGAFQTTPHGPERDFAPLALMQFNGANQPLLLERWLDDRFPPLCQLEADDIAFDGDRIGSDSDTVQEVIEELWERNVGGCCEFTISSTQGDAADAVRDILQDTQGEVTICFEPGVYTFTTQLIITNRKVVLKGCPRAVVVAGVNSMLRVTGTGHLVLEEMILLGRQADGVRILIDMIGQDSALEAHAVGLFVSELNPAAPPTIAIRVNDQEPPAINAQSPVPITAPGLGGEGPSIRLDQCVAAASWMISAGAINGLEVTGSFFSCGRGCIASEALTNVIIRGSDLLAGVNVDMIAAWTPQALLANADQLAEQLVDVLDALNPSATTICIRARQMSLAEISDCRLTAGIGIAAMTINEASLQGNIYAVSNMGLFLVSALDTKVTGEHIAALGQNAIFGVQLVLSGGFSITDCIITGFRVAIALGSEIGAQNQRQFRSVQVQNNQIVAGDIGIQVGTVNGISYLGSASHVALTENTITSGALGILLNAITAEAIPGQTVFIGQVRVADNFVTARLGVGVTGTAVGVSDNRIRLINGSGPRFGILARNSNQLVCESNQVELRPAMTQEGVSYASPLPSASVQRVGVFGPYISSANFTSAAIQIVDGSDARVATNTTLALGEFTLNGLAVDMHTQLAVKGNDFLSGPTSCSGLSDVVFLSNTVSGRISINNSDSGMVCDNRVRRRSEGLLNGKLSITNARGDWKVADNQVDRNLEIKPVLEPIVVGNWFIILAEPVLGYRASAIEGLNAIGTLADDERFVALMFREPGGDKKKVEALSRKSESRGVEMAVGNANWKAAYINSINEYVLADLRGEVKFVDDPQFDIVYLYYNEVEVRVQCNSNWARDIEIGNTGSVNLNSETIVQVIGNRAGKDIIVPAYDHLVIAMNVASGYTLAGSSQKNAILGPNLEI
jgi:uncharacterized protein DUF6519